MPSYTFEDTVTRSRIDKIMSIRERDLFLLENPNYRQKLSAPPLADPMRLGVTKTPDSFQDLLKNASKKNPRNTINARR